MAHPHDLLVVGAYPAVDAIVTGRFVADQVGALLATGRVRPAVVAFESAILRGPAALRAREAAAVESNVRAALTAAPAFAPAGAAGARDVPVARLAIAAGSTSSGGTDRAADARAAALDALLEATPAPPWSLVHAHVGYPAGAAAARAAARLGVPLVITEHASYLPALLADPTVLEQYRGALRAGARVVVVSRMLGREVLAIVPEIADRLVVIPNTVDVDVFALGRPEARTRGELLWVGGRAASKGIETLLRAFALVRARDPGAVLRMQGPPGPGAGDDAWTRLARDLGVADAVTIEGPADRPAVAAAMARADLFVHPSPRETFGIVAAEALATGLPVVATDSGGVTEILGDDPGALGAIVPQGDPGALAAAILSALDRRASFEPERLRAHAIERYAASSVAARLADLYDEILTDEPEGARRVAPSGQGAPLVMAGRPADRRDVIVVGFSRLELDRARAGRAARAIRNAGSVSTDGRIAEGDHWRPSTLDVALADRLGWGLPASGLLDRLRRLARRVTAPVRREPPVDALLDRLSAVLDRELPPPGPVPPLVVPLSGLDHLVVAPFVASGRARVAPGGVRWLADAVSAAPEPGQPSSDA